MSRRSRALVAAACAATLIGGPALASAGGKPDADPAVDAAQALIERIRDRTEGSAATISEAETNIDGLVNELAILETDGRPAAAALERQERSFARESDAVMEEVLAWTPPQAPTLPELSEPLEAVVGALHVGDEYAAALIERLADVAGGRTELERLGAEVHAIRFELEGELAGLRTDLGTAIRVSALQDSTEAPDPVQQFQSLIGRTQTAVLELRRAEARVRALSVALGEEREGLLVRVDDVQVDMDALNGQLAAVEWLIGERLGTRLDGPFPFELVEGVLQVCPVDPPRAYSDDFGAPRWSGGYHPHQGNDIFAPEGTPIRAPFDGTAVAVPNELGGEAVKVFGATGYVYNAHLSAYGKLGEVVAGDIIGFVGNTGNAINTPPHDHFEWHPGNGPAVNPFALLNAACMSPAQPGVPVQTAPTLGSSS